MELSQFAHGLAVGACFTVATWAVRAQEPPIAVGAIVLGLSLGIMAALVRNRR